MYRLQKVQNIQISEHIYVHIVHMYKSMLNAYNTITKSNLINISLYLNDRREYSEYIMSVDF